MIAQESEAWDLDRAKRTSTSSDSRRIGVNVYNRSPWPLLTPESLEEGASRDERGSVLRPLARTP